MRSPKKLTAFIIIAATFTYAIVRYHVIRGVAWSELPLFISNKAVALSAVAFIALSYSLGSLAAFWPHRFEQTLPARKFFGLLGFGFAALHSVMSLVILSPAYYARFFEESGKLSLIGELSILFGVVSFAVFSLVAITSIPSIFQALGKEKWLQFQHLGYWGMLVILGHVFVMGYRGWMDTASWPGGLLPISLVAAIILFVALFLRGLSRILR